MSFSSCTDAICVCVTVSEKREGGGWREREKEEPDEIVDREDLTEINISSTIKMYMWELRGLIIESPLSVA